MGWLLGNIALFSVIGVVCLLWWAYGALMWWLGLPPNNHTVLNVIGAVLALSGGYTYAMAMLRLIRKLEYRRALR